MKIEAAKNYLMNQPMYRLPVSRKSYGFLTKAQFDRLVKEGFIKEKKTLSADATTGWRFVEVTEYYV